MEWSFSTYRLNAFQQGLYIYLFYVYTLYKLGNDGPKKRLIMRQNVPDQTQTRSLLSVLAVAVNSWKIQIVKRPIEL